MGSVESMYASFLRLFLEKTEKRFSFRLGAAGSAEEGAGRGGAAIIVSLCPTLQIRLAG